MNMETKHFASDIPYKRNYNGKIMQVYKGEEIKHSTISRDKLKEIDKVLDIYNDYIIISNRMKNRMSIDDLEKTDQMDEKNRKDRIIFYLMVFLLAYYLR